MTKLLFRTEMTSLVVRKMDKGGAGKVVQKREEWTHRWIITQLVDVASVVARGKPRREGRVG